MRPNDPRVEPFLAGLEHADGGSQGDRSQRRDTPALRWKLLAVAIFLVLLVVLISKQAF